MPDPVFSMYFGKKSMPLDPLISAKLKFNRALLHMNNLSIMLDDHKTKKPAVALLVKDITGGGFEIATLTRFSVPDEISMIFSDSIHNFRTCLDSLAHDAVLLCGKIPKSTYFPFCQKPQDIKHVIKKSMNGIDAETSRLFEDMKPYPGGNDILRGLHDCDKFCKHRAVLKTATLISARGGDLIFNPSINAYIPDLSTEKTKPFDPSDFDISSIKERNAEIVGEICNSSVDFIIREDQPFALSSMIEVLNSIYLDVYDVIDKIEVHFKKRGALT